MGGFRNQGSPQQSPLRAGFGVRGSAVNGVRRVGFEGAGAGSEGSSEGGGYTAVNVARGNMGGGIGRTSGGTVKGRMREDEIDKLLDEEGESSDEEEIELRCSPSSKVAAGRV